MPYLTHADLQRDSLDLGAKLLHRFPDLVGIVAVPRSGMIPASLIATAADLPLYTVAGNEIRSLGHGMRLDSNKLGRSGTLALIDDSANSGRAMREARNTATGLDVVTAAVYATSKSAVAIDIVGRVVELPHFFAWHLFGSSMIERLGFALDFDGIICRDPLPAEYVEPSPAYERFIRDALPLHLPRPSRIPVIITARLERYREATAAWLARHHITFDKLIMGPWESPAERSRADIGAWKANEFLRSGARRFIESEPRQARRIHELTGALVICPTTSEVFA